MHANTLDSYRALDVQRDTSICVLPLRADGVGRIVVALRQFPELLLALAVSFVLL